MIHTQTRKQNRSFGGNPYGSQNQKPRPFFFPCRTKFILPAENQALVGYLFEAHNGRKYFDALADGSEEGLKPVYLDRTFIVEKAPRLKSGNTVLFVEGQIAELPDRAYLRIEKYQPATRIFVETDETYEVHSVEYERDPENYKSLTVSKTECIASANKDEEIVWVKDPYYQIRLPSDKTIEEYVDERFFIKYLKHSTRMSRSEWLEMGDEIRDRLGVLAGHQDDQD